MYWLTFSHSLTFYNRLSGGAFKMDLKKFFSASFAFLSLAAFAASVDYYRNSHDANVKIYSQAIDSFNSADRKAEKMLSLSIMQNLDAELYADTSKEELHSLHSCMHRIALQSDISIQYKTVFIACVKGL